VKRTIAVVLVLGVLVAGVLYTRSARSPNPPATPVAAAPPEAPAPATGLPGATLLDGLGTHHFEIGSRVPEVARWFDQGLMLTYGFNHDAAERSFLRATQLDPECAMCWWGAALVLGPHVNSAMDPANADKAWQRLQRALELAPKASAREQAWIRALSARYAKSPPADRKALDEAWATATGQLAAAYPQDLDAATFHAEAMMDTQPWDYYDAALRPKGHTAEIVATLESVLQRNPEHPGALHLYVHAVEASADPQRGVAAADRLRTLIPGSGHLVHMPAHIYSRVGRWHDAVLANQVAIAADAAYLATCGKNVQGLYPLGYVPHNFHFLWFAASMVGESKAARDAARQTHARTENAELMRQAGFEGLQHYWLTPWFDDVRFGRWEEISSKPNPAPDLPYPTAIWHYAQGMAALRLGHAEQASTHYGELKRLAADPKLEQLKVWDRYSLANAARIAERTLFAEIETAAGRHEAAIAALREAAKIEDATPYDEPPAWHSPVRQTLGAVLLAANRPAQAEAAYREELKRNPDNGWSLFGLAQAQRAQHQDAAAAETEARFATVWQHADVKLGASRF
jgi:hypothetical protein